MPPALRDELRQIKPFVSLEEETFLNLSRTASVLRDALERVLTPAGLTLAQYNVLRILRGAGAGGLCRNEVRDRLVTRMPDVTRLLDRMEEAGLINRIRGSEDRRLVATHLTREGRRLVDSLDGTVAGAHKKAFARLPREKLSALNDLLGQVRSDG